MTGRSMSIIGATAAFALLSGLHLEIAAGRSLNQSPTDDARLRADPAVAGFLVNRDDKADRQAGASNSTGEGRTIVFEHPDLQSTTVALRLWEAASTAKSQPVVKGKAPTADKPKHSVACEGVVSALTEIAKRLDPGRCIT